MHQRPRGRVRRRELDDDAGWGARLRAVVVEGCPADNAGGALLSDRTPTNAGDRARAQLAGSEGAGQPRGGQIAGCRGKRLRHLHDWRANYRRGGGRRYTDPVRAGVFLLSCLALSTNASAQLAVLDAPVSSTPLDSDSFVVTGDPGSCLVPSTLSLAAISERGSSMGLVTRQTGVCRWVFRGLDPGVYEIGLTHARGSGGRIRFEYLRGQTTEVRIPAPTVRVTGVVRINGDSVPGAQIMFTTGMRAASKDGRRRTSGR